MYSYYNCYYELYELRAHINYYLEPTVIHKIVETNSSFHVKHRTMGKVQFLFFRMLFFFYIKHSYGNINQQSRERETEREREREREIFLKTVFELLFSKMT